MNHEAKVTQGVLFEADVPPAQTKRPNPMRRVFGPGPVDACCGSCRHLRRFQQAARAWHKCDLRQNTHGRSTDQLAGWSACGKYEENPPMTPDTDTRPLFASPEEAPGDAPATRRGGGDVPPQSRPNRSGRTASPDAKSLARREDPETSKAAARAVAAGGLARLQTEALELVRRHPGRTQAELAAIAAVGSAGYYDSRRIGRRLPELMRDGAITKGAPRRCKVTGRAAATWWPA